MGNKRKACDCYDMCKCKVTNTNVRLHVDHNLNEYTNVSCSWTFQNTSLGITLYLP